MSMIMQLILLTLVPL